MSSLPLPRKKEITVTLEWSFDPASLFPAKYVVSKVFGSKYSTFDLSVHKKSHFVEEKIGFVLHLCSSNQPNLIVEGEFKFKNKESTVWIVETPITRKINRKGFISFGSFSPFSGFCDTVWKLTFEESQPPIDHSGLLLGQLTRLQLDSSLADITLITKIDEKKFPCSKDILSLRSSVFATMFRNGQFAAKPKKQVEIEDISGEVMESLLKYIYSGDVGGIDEIADKLLVAADKYNLPFLVEECSDSIVSNLCISNAAYFFHFANLTQQKELKKEIGKFIVKNKRQVRQSDGFMEFIRPDSNLVDQFIDLLI